MKGVLKCKDREFEPTTQTVADIVMETPETVPDIPVKLKSTAELG
jgi:hypothetical protein